MAHHDPSTASADTNIVTPATDPYGLAQNDAEEATPAFPILAPLSHDLEGLSPKHSADFDVDDFLSSRAKASDLNYILSDLRTYNESLKEELVSIINEDYKDFVSLGSDLRSESHRIVRLGWSTSSGSEGPLGGGMAPVREALVQSRSTLKGVEDDIRDCMKRREEVSDRKASLELMLQLHESVTRLEGLLLIPATRSSGRKSSFLGSAAAVSASRAGQGGEPMDPSRGSGEDNASDSEYGMTSDDVDDEQQDESGAFEDYPYKRGPNAPAQTDLLGPDGIPLDTSLIKSPSPMLTTAQDAARKKQRRRSKVRPPSFGQPNSPGHALSASHSPSKSFLSLAEGDRRKIRQKLDDTATSASSLLGLPQRVTRTSAEYSRLRFLSRRVEAEGLSGFLRALESRMEHIRATLRQDLRALLKSLLSPSSLLVRGPIPTSSGLTPSRPTSQARSPTSQRRSSLRQPARNSVSAAAYELESWSQVAPPADRDDEAEARYWSDRLQEQRTWLELVLGTLTSLGLPGQATDGAEEGRSGSAVTQQETGARSAREAEEAVREIMVQSWASRVVCASALRDSGPQLDSFESVAITSHSEALGTSEKAQRRLETILLKPEDILQGQPESALPDLALLHLFNRVLAFAAMEAWHVCDAAEAISSHERRNTYGTADGEEGGGPNNVVPPAASTVRDPAVVCDVFVNVLWDEVVSRLMDDELGSSIFFVGRPDAFYRNYTVAAAFLDRFASLAPSSRARSALLRHPLWSTFRKRWQLPVYFQMRFREIVTKLEEGLANGTHAPSTIGANNQSASPPLMQATHATLQALRAPWSRGVHLHELAAREWRVTLQILSRYKTWVESEIPDGLVTGSLGAGSAATTSTTASTRRVEGLRQHSRTGSDGSRSSIDGSVRISAEPSRVPTPVSGRRQSSDASDSASSDDATLRHLTALAVDITHLDAALFVIFDNEIRPRLLHGVSDAAIQGQSRSEVDTESGDALVMLLKGTLSETMGWQTSVVEQIRRVVVSLLKTRCADPLRMVRSVGTQFRSAPSSGNTNAGDKVEPSAFIEQVLRPLRAYFGLPIASSDKFGPDHTSSTSVGGAAGSHLPSLLKSAWATDVLEDLTARYASSLVTMNKNHESLRRLKRGGGGGGLSGFASSLFGGGGASASGNATTNDNDETGERMKRQMQADVEALRTGVEALRLAGVDVDVQAENWKRLDRAANGSTDETM